MEIALIVLGVILAIVGPVVLVALVMRSKHPDAVSGSLLGFLEVIDGPSRLAWYSWSIFGITREGEITHGGPPNSGRVRVRRSIVCGLIPLGSVERPLADFYRVKVESAVSEDTNTTRITYYRGSGQVTMDHPEIAVFYTVLLVPRRGYELTLLAFTEDFEKTKGESVIGRFRTSVETIIGVPGQVLPAAAKPVPKLQGPRNVCPNCKGDFPTTVQRCPRCRVELFAG